MVCSNPHNDGRLLSRVVALCEGGREKEGGRRREGEGGRGREWEGESGREGVGVGKEKGEEEGREKEEEGGRRRGWGKGKGRKEECEGKRRKEREESHHCIHLPQKQGWYEAVRLASYPDHLVDEWPGYETVYSQTCSDANIVICGKDETPFVLVSGNRW